MSSCSLRFSRCRARSSDAVTDSLARRRATLEIIEPLAPLLEGAAAFLFPRGSNVRPAALHQKESIEI
jgi:hypothetical protein